MQQQYPVWRKFSKARVAAFAVVALLGTSGAAWNLASKAPAHPDTVMAEFTDVSPILPREPVKAHGVTVGTVGQPQVEPGGHKAMVPLNLDRSAFPIHTDATAKVEPISLLGAVYIRLDPGSANAPILNPGQAIPASQTSRYVNLQDVLNTVDGPTGDALSSMVTTLGQATNHNGENIKKTLAVLESSLGNTDQLVKVLKDQNQLLGNVVDRVEPVTSALAADHGKTLNGLVGSANKLLTTTASRNRQLQSTLKQLPATLTEANKTFTDLTHTSRTASKTLKDLRPTTDKLSELSKRVDAFSQAATPALADADPVLEKADKLLDQARPVARELDKAGPNLKKSVADARPLVTDLHGNLANVLSFVRDWALATNGSDGLSHYLRASVVLSPQMISGLLPDGTANLGPEPGQREKPRPRTNEPGGPAQSERQTKESMKESGKSSQNGSDNGSKGGSKGEHTTKSPSSGSGLVGGLLQNQDNPSKSETGLSKEQEQGALGFLLGGL
jgi:phospholipid/cholesterol/gamma-HCH transport system substrate-binding protein